MPVLHKRAQQPARHEKRANSPVAEDGNGENKRQRFTNAPISISTTCHKNFLPTSPYAQGGARAGQSGPGTGPPQATRGRGFRGVGRPCFARWPGAHASRLGPVD